jgi:hypothetical protein
MLSELCKDFDPVIISNRIVQAYCNNLSNLGQVCCKDNCPLNPKIDIKWKDIICKINIE